MNHRLYIYIFLSFAVVIAGCIDGGRTKTEIVSEDMLKIKNIDIFPSKTLQPEDAIVIRMEVENAGQDAAYLLVDKDTTQKTKEGIPNPDWNGDYLLIDHCSTLYRDSEKFDSKFQILSGGRCVEIYDASDTEHENPKIPLVKDSNGNEIGISKDKSGNETKSCYLKLSPRQSHTFQWTMKAPKETEIAKMTHKCTFKFQTAYAAKAVTNTYVYFADPLEVAQRLYTNKEMNLAGDNIASYGPVAVNFVPAEPQPIPAKKDGTWTVFLNLKNAGEGIADVSEMNLVRPENIEVIGSKILGCNGLNVLDKNIELVDAMKNFGISDNALFVGALNAYVVYCPKEQTPNPYCKADLLELAKEYDKNLCPSNPNQPEANDPTCSMTISEITSALESEKSKLQISKEASSRIPCELTMPTGVTILTPFRFVTTADYTYKIRQDVEITTKPIKEVA